MATVDWPSIDTVRPPSTIKPSTTKFRYKSDFEGGYTQVTAKFTKPKKKFELSWGTNGDHHVLNKEQMLNLLDFFENNAGNVIKWNNRIDEKDYYVIFSEDELSFDEIRPGSEYYSCTVMLEEA